MPAPPHPGRGRGPWKGPPSHRCCPSRTSGRALGVEVGALGPNYPRPILGADDSWALPINKDLVTMVLCVALALGIPLPLGCFGCSPHLGEDCCVKHNKEKPKGL